ncbi:DUF4983 domain-containing protein [Pedobacter foliorum]|uniref:DUF4983 domain-containing protein n=1 Tax=Pedobacter foliorum TaxID=2739058 RepID=UPI001565BF78|nr:DUF4983 domain-containing protein [Pedobacter foliorum]NRF39025.1 DUF4983 domain-containing protein [Pedobacter foliorum]
MNKINTYTHKLVAIITVALFIMIFSACNKDFPNRLKESSQNDTSGISAKNRKVLYIILDGVRGKALKAINPPNIAKITNNSVYAFDALSDFDENVLTNAGAWSNMLTGVTKDKHDVISNDFSGNKLAAYPSMISRLKQANPQLRTVSIASSVAFNTNLASDAVLHQEFENDDLAVKNAVNEELKRDDATFVLAQFHSAELAGKANDYEEGTIAYVNAILKIDNYIGEIMTSLRSRKTFSDENWLVVIASSKGGEIAPDGSAVDNTSYGDATRNSFIVFYNPRFSTLFIPKPASDAVPYTGTAPNFAGNDSKISRAVIQDATAFNMGLNDFTVEVKVKVNNGGEYYPPILGKRATFNGNVIGWLFFLEGDDWQLNLSSTSGGNIQANGGAIRDGFWHTLTAKFYKDGATRKASVYTDGVLKKTIDITSRGNIDSPAPFTLGYITGSGGSIDVILSDIQFYNVAIPDNVIKAQSRKTYVDSSHPYFNNLIGYWPGDEGKGDVIKDKSSYTRDFRMQGTAQWQQFNEFTPYLDPIISSDFYKIVPNSVDIPFEIYQWLGVSVPKSWNLDGKSWNPIYSDIKP